MKCIECGRALGVPYVMASGGPLGPKCARSLGVERPRVPRDPRRRARLFEIRAVRQRADARQLELELVA